MQAVLERLEKLERQNRRLKQAGTAVLIVTALLALMGQASPKKTIEANEFILRDDSGNVRGRLTVDDNTMGAFLILSGKDGIHDSVVSSGLPAGEPGILMNTGQESLVLAPSSIGFWHSGKEKGAEPVAKAQFSSAALFVSDDQGFEATLGTQELVTPRTGETHKTSAASLVLFDKDKNVIWKAP
jgi:hypothetical protein